MAWWEDWWLPSATHNTFLSQLTIPFCHNSQYFSQQWTRYFSEPICNTFLHNTAILHEAGPTISFADVEPFFNNHIRRILIACHYQCEICTWLVSLAQLNSVRFPPSLEGEIRIRYPLLKRERQNPVVKCLQTSVNQQHPCKSTIVSSAPTQLSVASSFFRNPADVADLVEKLRTQYECFQHFQRLLNKSLQ